LLPALLIYRDIPIEIYRVIWVIFIARFFSYKRIMTVYAIELLQLDSSMNGVISIVARSADARAEPANLLQVVGQMTLLFTANDSPVYGGNELFTAETTVAPVAHSADAPVARSADQLGLFTRRGYASRV
jgi:hypothetical protein